MAEQVNLMVCKAPSNATATVTPSSVDAWLLIQLGAKLLDIFKVKGQNYYAFTYRDIEKTADGYTALRQAAERAKENQTIADQRGELLRRLRAAVAVAMTKGRVQ